MFGNQRFGPFAQQDEVETSGQQSQEQRGYQNNGSGDSNASHADKTKLIVNYVPQNATEDDLAVIFSQVGPLESIRIMRDYKTGYSYGFGFVKYVKSDDAAKAIDVVNGMNYRNKRLKVSYSRPPGQDMKDSNLYITNLPRNITEGDIDKMFGDFGEIVQKTVLKDKITGMPRGVAFVRFSKGEEAQAAIAQLDGKQLEDSLLPLSVRVAEDHGRQKAQYIDSWNQAYMYSRGYPVPFRGGMPFRDVPPVTRGNFASRGNRFTNAFNTNRYLGMGAGDNLFHSSMFW